MDLMKDQAQAIYTAGMVAAGQGQQMSDCPYEIKTRQYLLWRLGWNDYWKDHDGVTSGQEEKL